MQFYFFHLMPYARLPETYTGPAWVTCPNELFVPDVGAELYNRYLDELISAEPLGFDGVVINEHHSTAYGLMPSPNLIGAILARATRRIRIAVLGNALPLYNPPTRVAEEWGMIDVISGGRLDAGMVLGGGPEYFASSLNPAFARERFREAHDLIVRAWTEPGPFSFMGRHYQLRNVNVWPRPLQKPHPPIWIPGMGSLETMRFIAERRYSFMGIPYFHRDVVLRNLGLFRDACLENGYVPAPERMGWLAPIYVAETDAQARAEYESHFWYFVNRLLPGINIQPPGYVTPQSLKNVVRGFSRFITNVRTWQDVEEGAFAIVGSPETVRRRLQAELEELGAGCLLGMFQMGSLPADLTRRSMELFASEVMPRLRQGLTTGGHS
jgi:alkanesulfonate monooxygenase SsuD/methylene tetrahydromethanopterin reductase-like flavin-dependent oxidoreductase (luciferase family)